MSDKTESSNPSTAKSANSGQSSGSNAAGTGDNPQDGKDTSKAGETRPRGKTEDPDITL